MMPRRILMQYSMRHGSDALPTFTLCYRLIVITPKKLNPEASLKQCRGDMKGCKACHRNGHILWCCIRCLGVNQDIAIFGLLVSSSKLLSFTQTPRLIITSQVPLLFVVRGLSSRKPIFIRVGWLFPGFLSLSRTIPSNFFYILNWR